MNLYFAYGSNMDQRQMKERCPESKLLGKAFLNNYRLAFTIFFPKRNCGCADIIKSKGNTVCGLLYELNDKDMKAMDQFEGCPKDYRRVEVKVKNEEGKVVKAVAYEVVEKSKSDLETSRHYLGLIKGAAEVFDFPEDYRKFLNNFKTLD